MKEQKRLLVGYLGRVLLDSVVRVPIGNEQIHPFVVIDVGRNRSPGFPVSLTDAGFLRDITKRAVAVVMKQVARHRLIDSGKAVVAFAGTSVAAKLVL